MKTLVVFYSRDGHTKKVAEDIAKILNADIDEIIDAKSRKGVIGWIIAGKDAMRKKPTEIGFKKSPSEYDLVLIGTPVWAFTMTPAVRTYLSLNKFRKAAFFCTYGGGESKTFNEMEKSSIAPVAVFGYKDKDIGNEEYTKKLEEFCSKLR